MSWAAQATFDQIARLLFGPVIHLPSSVNGPAPNRIWLFENAAEAQQAVQLLLGGGITSDTIQLSTQPDSSVGDNETFPGLAKADKSSGHFFSSLFGNQGADRSEPVGSGVNVNRRSPLPWPGSRCLTIQTRSADESKRVTALLERAGAGEVALRKGSATSLG